MSDPLGTGVGRVLSADIAVPEHEREVRFYSRVLSTGENPLWRKDLMNNLGMPVIGLGARIPDYAHLPLQWMPHIQVVDVAVSVGRALDLGGSQLMHGRTTMGTASGRCCSIRMGQRSGSSQSYLRRPPLQLTVPSRATVRRGWDVSPGST